MIHTLKLSIHGPRHLLEKLKRISGHPTALLADYPTGSGLLVGFDNGSLAYEQALKLIAKHGLQCQIASESWRASEDELRTEQIFACAECPWIDDPDAIDSLSYSSAGCCPACGAGAIELTVPIRGVFKPVRSHLLRIPQALVLVSHRLARHASAQGWTGCEFRPVIDRRTGRESDRFVQAAIRSILPPMHPDAPIERSCVPEFCSVCRRRGYQMRGRQPYYSRSILEVAQDWNLSVEWLAPHCDPVPKLICSKRVVEALLALESFVRWVPLYWCD